MGMREADAGWRKVTDDYDPSTIIHELTHMLTHDMLVNLPIWANEAYAEYISNIPIKDTAIADPSLTRRGAIGGLGSLLALGAWHGARAAEAELMTPATGPIRFVAVNDFHHEDPDCDETLPTLDPLAPTVLATHFPLSSAIRSCPLNADAVLARFIGHNLRGVFGGHYHARTSAPRGDIHLITNACVARVRDNHDKTPEKGYLVVDGDANGRLKTSFVQFTGE